MELLEEQKAQIERKLYTQVMLLIEREYNVEGILDQNKKGSTRIVFKDKKIAIQNVIELIKRFAQENNLDMNSVKNYLINTIEKNMKNNNIFKEEYEEVKEIILIDEDIEER